MDGADATASAAAEEGGAASQAGNAEEDEAAAEEDTATVRIILRVLIVLRIRRASGEQRNVSGPARTAVVGIAAAAIRVYITHVRVLKIVVVAPTS